MNSHRLFAGTFLGRLGICLALALAMALATGTSIGLAAAPGEALVCERFEGRPAGQVCGGVTLVRDVVGYGGLDVPNLQSARFDGKPGTRVDCGVKKLVADQFTVEAFFKLAGPAQCGVIACDWNETGDARTWALVVQEGGVLRFDVSPDGQFYLDNKLEGPWQLVRPGVWYHVAAVSRGAQSELYVNGRLVVRRVRGKAGVLGKSPAHVLIGGCPRWGSTERSFDGWIDEVRITPRALSPAEFVHTKQPMPAVASAVAPLRYQTPFSARSRDAAIAWQTTARAKLLQLVADQRPRYSLAQAPLDLRIESSEDRGAYTLSKVSFRGNNADGARWPGLLAVPKGAGPFPGFVALHGHGGKAELVFDPASIYKGFADRFARGGYVVFAPSLTHQDYAAMLLWDLMRCVDILQARRDVDPKRIGAGGLSMGGEWTMWLSACDQRIAAAVVSGWMCTTEGVFAVPNCICWQLPGFVELMDVCEVNLLCAPRPVVFESASEDGCFPIRYTKEGFARIRAGYAVFGATDAVRQDIWTAGHEWHGTLAYPAMDKALGGHAAK